jgi:hypothetical protein
MDDVALLAIGTFLLMIVIASRRNGAPSAPSSVWVKSDLGRAEKCPHCNELLTGKVDFKTAGGTGVETSVAVEGQAGKVQPCPKCGEPVKRTPPPEAD